MDAKNAMIAKQLLEKVLELNTDVDDVIKAAERSSDRRIVERAKSLDRTANELADVAVKLVAIVRGVAPGATITETLKVLSDARPIPRTSQTRPAMPKIGDAPSEALKHVGVTRRIL